ASRPPGRRTGPVPQSYRQRPPCPVDSGACNLAGPCCPVIHFSTPTRVHTYTVVRLGIHPNRPQIHTQVATLAGPGAGVIGASSQAAPGTCCERGGLWPGDLAESPPSGALSRRPATRPATTSSLAGTRLCPAGPAARRRELGAGARQRARRRAADAG